MSEVSAVSAGTAFPMHMWLIKDEKFQDIYCTVAEVSFERTQKSPVYHMGVHLCHCGEKSSNLIIDNES